MLELKSIVFTLQLEVTTIIAVYMYKHTLLTFVAYSAIT